MTTALYYKIMMEENADNLYLANDDAFVMIELMRIKDTLNKFKITINEIPEKTNFKKIKP